jgi:cation diffusion facilitator CzcD-associated flavoprotein CzcO
MAKRFAIIGAGAAGLCSAKHLLAHGLEPTIFEIGSNIGGLWVYNNDSGMSPAYRSLHINSEARVSCYEDFPFADGTPLYPNHYEMHRYFKAYAEKFGLTNRIRFNSRVTAIEPEGSGYRIRLENGKSETFDGVVVGTGHQSSPRHPPEVKGFTGEYVHAHSYRVPEPYSDKRVLVIGPGNSGVDIAADVCTVSRRTVLVARNPVLIMPRMMFGVPNSRTLVKLEKWFIPWSVRVWARIRLTRIFHGTMEQWGFRTPNTRTHPISHPTLISHMAWGRVVAKPGISKVDGQVVHFVDGSSETFDAIIACTGYTTTFPYLPEGTSPLNGTRLDLFHRIVHPKLPGVYFVGFFDASGGSNVRMMDDQSEYVAGVASGVVKLPSTDEMMKSIAEDHEFQKSQFPDSPRYGLELDPRRYRKRLANEYRKSGITRPIPIKEIEIEGTD